MKLIVLGLNHEQQHQELFYTDLKYIFSLNPLHPAFGDRAFCEEGVEEGMYKIGHTGQTFFTPILGGNLPVYDLQKNNI